MGYSTDIAFTPAVKATQARNGSRELYANYEKNREWRGMVTPDLAAFVTQADMFYMGTASSEGQPYIQYKGGPRGFLRVIDEKTLGFADFSGNRQYISQGNLSENGKAFIFLMDYVGCKRVKIWGTARIVEDDPALMAKLEDPAYEARVERGVLFTIEAWDTNCPKHIHRRLPADEVEPVIEGLRRRVAELESKLASARSA